MTAHTHEETFCKGDMVQDKSGALRYVERDICDASGCFLQIRKPFTSNIQIVPRKDWVKFDIQNPSQHPR